MTEPPITEPESTAPAIPVSTKPESRRRSLRKSAQVPTVQLARLTSISGIIFAALFVVAIILVHTTPTLSASDAEITAYYAGGSYRTLKPTKFDTLSIAITVEMFQ